MERPAALSSVELDNLCINTIRFLSVDAVEKADSGHPGLPMGAAPMAYVLWTRFLKHNPTNPDWMIVTASSSRRAMARCCFTVCSI